MLTISDIEDALKKHFKIKPVTDGLEIREFKEPSGILITLKNGNVIVQCEAKGQTFVNRIPVSEFLYCVEADDRDIYMLRMFCSKCDNFVRCASIRKSLSECRDNVFMPTLL